MITTIIALAAIALLVAADQITKLLIASRFEIGESKHIIGGLLDFTYVQNRGAAFGMLSNQRWIFLVLTTVIIIGICWLWVKGYIEHITGRISAVLIVAGGIGNMIDRFAYGYVVDFIDVKLLPFWKWIFNVADMFVTVGAVPAMAIGTFNGFVYAPGGNGEPSGTFTLTATATGKLTAKAVTAAGTTSWSANGWTYADDSVYEATIVQIKKSGKVSVTNAATFSVSLVDVGYDDFQLSGTLDFGDGEGWNVSAQRNPYGKSGRNYENPEAVAAVNALAGTYLIDAETGAKVTVTKTTGAAKLAAKIGGKAVSASASDPEGPSSVEEV